MYRFNLRCYRIYDGDNYLTMYIYIPHSHLLIVNINGSCFISRPRHVYAPLLIASIYIFHSSSLSIPAIYAASAWASGLLAGDW